MLPDVNQFVEEQYNQDPYFGKLTDSNVYIATTEGGCGDDMTFYLCIEKQKISKVKFYSKRGCGHTRAAGRYVAQFAKGKSVLEAMEISAAEVLDENPILLKGGQHCSILAVTTFLNAIAEYLLDGVED